MKQLVMVCIFVLLIAGNGFSIKVIAEQDGQNKLDNPFLHKIYGVWSVTETIKKEQAISPSKPEIWVIGEEFFISPQIEKKGKIPVYREGKLVDKLEVGERKREVQILKASEDSVNFQITLEVNDVGPNRLKELVIWEVKIANDKLSGTKVKNTYRKFRPLILSGSAIQKSDKIQEELIQTIEWDIEGVRKKNASLNP